jgi:DNA-directed RNA polymerase specialized sigma24 family protein
MDRRRRIELRNADWEDIGIRLTAYAVWKTRNLQWRSGHAGALAAGKTAEDLAADAILKVIEGTRAWDPARGPLLTYLQRVVDSLVNHLAQSADNRLQTPLRSSATPLAAHLDAWSDPNASGHDAEGKVERLRSVLRAQREGDLLEVLEAIRNCDPTPQAVAAHLGTTVADINNRLKRLRRLAQRIAKRPTTRARVG